MKRKHWLVPAFACVLLAQSQPPPPSPTKSGQEKKGSTPSKDTNTQDRKDRPSVSVVVNTPITQNPTEQKNSPSSPEHVIEILTGVIALAAIAQAVIYFFQTQLMSKSLTETTKAADAAKASADAVITQFEVTQRPWCKIGLSAYQGITFSSDTMSFDFVVEVENVGRSPATSYHYECAVKLQHEGGPTLTTLRKNLTEAAINGSGHGFVLFPKAPGRGGFSATHNISDAPDLIGVNAVVAIAYRSTFSKSPKTTSAIFYVRHRVNGTFKKGQNVAWADICIDADPMYGTIAD